MLIHIVNCKSRKAVVLNGITLRRPIERFFYVTKQKDAHVRIYRPDPQL